MADGALRSFAKPPKAGELSLSFADPFDGLRLFAALEHDAKLEKALDGRRVRPQRRCNKRPGRAGRGDAFYAGIARDYMALRQEGSLKPTAELAKRLEVSRNTMAGWVRRARQRGLLPEARGNQPG